MGKIKSFQRAIIVGSGPSAKGFVPPDDVFVFAINGAIEWLAHTDVWFTLDVSITNIARMRNQKSGVQYMAAVPSMLLSRYRTNFPDIEFFERVTRQGVEPILKGTPEWWFWRWGCIPGLSNQVSRIHTGNSAYGALGVAFHMGFKSVALIGIDASDAPRIEGGIPRSLSHLPLLFKSALQQIDVTSCGAMNSIPKMAFHEWYHHPREISVR